MSDHARLSPSKRHRWSKCAGSINEEEKLVFKPEPSPSALDGTITHLVLEYCLKNNFLDITSKIKETMEFEGQPVVIDQQRAARVKLAVDYIENACMSGLMDMHSEQKVDPSSLLGRSDLFGTVDCWIDFCDSVEIIDYKDGSGEIEAIGNHQMEVYGWGILNEIGDYERIKEIKFTIIQPRMLDFHKEPIKSWVVPIDQFLLTKEKIIQEAALTDLEDAPFKTGDHCKYCPVKATCKTLHEEVKETLRLDEIEDAFNNVGVFEPSALSNDQILKTLMAAPLIRQFLEAVEDHAKQKMISGETIQGLKIVEGRGTTSWGEDEATIESALVKAGVPKKMCHTSKIVSVAQAKKLTWEKGGKQQRITPKQWEILNTYVSKKSGELKVAFESDSRNEVKFDASFQFSSVKKEA